MKIVSVILLLILPLSTTRPQPIEIKRDSIVIEKKVETKINDSLINVVNKEIERSEKLKNELMNATKNPRQKQILSREKSKNYEKLCTLLKYE